MRRAAAGCRRPGIRCPAVRTRVPLPASPRKSASTWAACSLAATLWVVGCARTPPPRAPGPLDVDARAASEGAVPRRDATPQSSSSGQADGPSSVGLPAVASPSGLAAAAGAPAAGPGGTPARVGVWSGAVDHGRPLVPFHGDAVLRAAGPLAARLLVLRHDPPTEGVRRALEAAPVAGAAAIALALRHESPQVRTGACRLLGAVGLAHPALRAALVALLRQDPDRDVRVAGATALIGRREPAFAETLAALLLGDDAARVRAAAAWALGTSGDEGAAVPLVGALQDRDAMTRLGAVSSLDRLRARDRLVQILALRDDPDPRVRRAVARAAQHLGSDHAAQPQGEHDALDPDR